jgi:hypothetical protein
LKLCNKLGTSASINEDFGMRETETALPDPKCECQCAKKPIKPEVIIPELYTPAPNKNKSLINPRLALFGAGVYNSGIITSGLFCIPWTFEIM